MSDQPHDPVNEYEREPVPEKALLGLKSYVGQFAGEPVAGTELMIGPLFLASGVSAFDFIFGLVVGNLLAVLSWTFFTAPIATRATRQNRHRGPVRNRRRSIQAHCRYSLRPAVRVAA